MPALAYTLTVIAALLVSAPARAFLTDEVKAEFERCQLYDGPRLQVKRVIDGDTIETSDGNKVRLLQINAPELGSEKRAQQPLAREAGAALREKLAGKTIRLMLDDSHYDRFGRVLAHIMSIGRNKTRWFQHEMVLEGMAMVYSFPDNRRCARLLLEAEKLARAQGRGIWALPHYAVRNAAKPSAIETSRFQIVAGRVVAVGSSRGRIFLNFGSNWKTDFTATIAPKDVPTFTNSDIDLEGLTGKEVEVRGWVFEYNGPSMQLTHPEQLYVN